MTLTIIAGFEPTGQAGIMRDAHTIHALDVRANYAITSICAANDKEVFSMQEAAQLKQQLPKETQTVKIGMIGTEKNAQNIVSWIDLLPKKAFVIYDTVHCASSGEELSSIKAIKMIIDKSDLVTLNLIECQQITGIEVVDKESAIKAREHISSPHCIIKGGHSQGSKCLDYIFINSQLHILQAPRIEGYFRGTGCCLSSAIAAYIEKEEMLENAIFKARLFLQKTIAPKTQVSDFFCTPLYEFPPCTPQIYPIISQPEQLHLLVQAGYEYVQLRIKNLCDSELKDAITTACKLSHQLGIKLFINDHVYLAISQGAYGVHLGQEDLTQTNIEALKKSSLRLGISTHNYLEIMTALALKPSYIAIGSIFETTTKDMTGKIQGLELLADYCKSVKNYLPIIAIGGINPENASQVFSQGPQGLSFVRATHAHHDYSVTKKAFDHAIGQ